MQLVCRQASKAACPSMQLVISIYTQKGIKICRLLRAG